MPENYPIPAMDITFSAIFGIILGIAVYSALNTKLLSPSIESGKNYAEWIKEKLEILYIDWPLKRCKMVPFISTAVFLIFASFFISPIVPANWLILALIGWTGYHIPRLVLEAVIKARIKKIDSQFVDALEMMANSLKSGLSFLQVMELVAKDSPSPINKEFRLIVSQHRMGIQLDDAIAKFAERIPSEDISMAVNSILILREMGGDLSETFESIARTIRERKKIESKIDAFTAQGRFQAGIIAVFPYVMIGILYMLSPDYVKPLFSHPIGWMILAAMAVLQFMGLLWMKKIIDIDV